MHKSILHQADTAVAKSKRYIEETVEIVEVVKGGEDVEIFQVVKAAHSD